jgi:putative FmdB family regulatory protein
MPTYLYKNTDTGEIYELRQSMRDDAYTAHPETGVPVKRVLARPSIAFKGSGFYVTDSRPRVSEGGGAGGAEGKSAPKTESKSSGGEG